MDRDRPEIAREVREGLAQRWTVEKVAALGTEEIVTKLDALGVRHSQARFLDLAVGRDSAWTIADVWLGESGTGLPGGDEDFLGMAACELWKRYLPKQPSFEMIDDWMQQGYRLVGSERGDAEACEVWARVWTLLLERAGPDSTKMADVDASFPGTQSFFNWAQDFTLALENASRHGERRYAELGRTVCEEWLARFPDEDALTQCVFRRSLSEFLFALGEVDQGVAALEAAVALSPDQVGGYVALGDAYAHFFDSTGPERDLGKALSYCRKGSAVSECSFDRDMFEERIADLERRAKSLPGK